MPFYDYRCPDCRLAFEVRMSMSRYRQGPHPTCPSCGSAQATRVLGTPEIMERKGAQPTPEDCQRCCGTPRGCGG